MEIITSKQNARVKEWRKLLTAKGRKKAQTFLIEGDHLAQEARTSQAPVKEWILTEQYYQAHLEIIDALEEPIYVITDALASSIATTQTPQGIFAVVHTAQKVQNWQPTGTTYLLLDGVQDPGNLGTMIRTADAASFDGVILGDGTVDLYNDKVIRATQGSLWHIDIIPLQLSQAITSLKQANIPVFVSELNEDAQSYQVLQGKQCGGIIMGNEGQGVSKDIIALADMPVYIPMPGQSESLNVAVAAGILMYKLIEKE